MCWWGRKNRHIYYFCEELLDWQPRRLRPDIYSYTRCSSGHGDLNFFLLLPLICVLLSRCWQAGFGSLQGFSAVPGTDGSLCATARELSALLGNETVAAVLFCCWKFGYDLFCNTQHSSCLLIIVSSGNIHVVSKHLKQKQILSALTVAYVCLYVCICIRI